MNTQRLGYCKRCFPVKTIFRQRYIGGFILSSCIIVIFVGSMRSMLINNVQVDIEISLTAPLMAPDIKGRQHIFLMILVLSTPEAIAQREAIRETWASSHNVESKSAVTTRLCKLVFILGGLQSIDETLKKESANSNDLLVGDFADTYRNLVVKVFVGLAWASKQNCTFVLKSDDDVYINLPRLTEWLTSPRLSSWLYAGEVVTNNSVIRSPWNKYSVSQLAYEPDFYPPYCRGAFYVLSRNTLPAILREVLRNRPLHIEDAFMGILAQKIGLQPVQIEGCTSSRRFQHQVWRWKDSDFRSMTCSGDVFNEPILRFIHYRYLYMKSKVAELTSN